MYKYFIKFTRTSLKVIYLINNDFKILDYQNIDILEVLLFFLVYNIVFHPVLFLHKVEGWLSVQTNKYMYSQEGHIRQV
jgi:hypothetical protein